MNFVFNVISILHLDYYEIVVHSGFGRSVFRAAENTLCLPELCRCDPERVSCLGLGSVTSLIQADTL